MQSGPEDRVALIRRYYQAYDHDDRAAMESLLHPQFTFTSPNDDRIDRRAYFERCWPNHESMEVFDLLDVCADTHHALVRYQACESAAVRSMNH